MNPSKMGIFNNIGEFTEFNVDQYNTQIQTGFKLTSDNNYDMENRKLTNVKDGTDKKDVPTMKQIHEVISPLNNLPAQVKPNKVVIYSPSGGIHANGLYLRDSSGQEVHFINEVQDDNQIRLYVPNLKNFDSYGGRLKSEIVVTSIEQTIPGKKIFQDIEVPIPTNDSKAVNLGFLKSYSYPKEVNETRYRYVKKSGDTMTGPLIVPKDSYPVQGDLNKVISYETQREIFLLKKEGGQMSQPIDMGNFPIENLPAATATDHTVNKDYVDNGFLPNKGGVMSGTLSMNNNDLIVLPDTPKFGYSAVNKNYVTTQLNMKLDKAADIDMKNKKITALTTDYADVQSATNVGYVKNAVNVSETNIVTTLTDRFDQKIKESHISSSRNKKDVFRYLMEDANESSSERDIIVDGIADFSGSPHAVNKKAYSLKLGKGLQNECSSRIGFNMFKLPEGEYTLAIKFFPRSMTNVSVDVVSTSLNIKQQATKLFPNYSRSIVHLHKWSITP